MPRLLRRVSVLSGITLCAILGGQVAVARASDNNLRRTINAFTPKIAKDEKAIRSGLKGYPQRKVKPLVRALKHEVTDLHALRSKIKQESASSARGRKAKLDIVKGLGLIASAYDTLRKDVQAAHGGAVPMGKLKAVTNTGRRGRTKFRAGLHLLS